MDAVQVKIQADQYKKSVFARRRISAIFIFAICALWLNGATSVVSAQGDALLKEVARLRADLKQVREDQVKLLARLEDDQNQINALMRQVQQLELRLAAAEQNDPGLSRIQRQLTGLQRALEQEIAARTEADAELIKSVSREIAAAFSRMEKSPARSASAADMQGEYTVQRGDTLGAIAQAFGTTTRRLKEANNLENDLIIEGQKLLIPK